MYRVKKEVIDGIEYLPDIVQTELWTPFERSVYYPKGSKEIRLVAGLYKLLALRENYFQDNTPTAFGNPEYNSHCGAVSGFLQGSEMTMEEGKEQYVIKRGKKTVLVVDRIKRNPAYFEAERENKEVLRDLGIGGGFRL